MGEKEAYLTNIGEQKQWGKKIEAPFFFLAETVGRNWGSSVFCKNNGKLEGSFICFGEAVGKIEGSHQYVAETAGKD